MKATIYEELLRVQQKVRRFDVGPYLKEHYPKIHDKILSTIQAGKKINAQAAYDYFNPKGRRTCLTCGISVVDKFGSLSKGYKPFCSISCSEKHPSTQEKKRQTNLRKRGTEWPSQSKAVRAKCVATSLQNYGTTHPMKSEEVKKIHADAVEARYGVRHNSQADIVKLHKAETNLRKSGGKYTTPFQDPEAMKKARATMKKKYGVETALLIPGMQEKLRENSLKKFGTLSPIQSEIVQAKSRATNLKRYGVEYSMQSPEVQDRQHKSAFASYVFKFKQKKFVVQGYEDMAIRILHKYGVTVSFIKTCSDTFPYVDSVTGKKRIYRPDLIIDSGSKKLYLEVKSAYTSGLSKLKTFSPNVRDKMLSVSSKGENCLVIVIRQKKGPGSRCNREGFITHCKLSTPYTTTNLKKKTKARSFVRSGLAHYFSNSVD